MKKILKENAFIAAGIVLVVVGWVRNEYWYAPLGFAVALAGEALLKKK